MENPEKTSVHVESLHDLVRRWIRQAEIDEKAAASGMMTETNTTTAFAWRKAAMELATHLPPESTKTTRNQRPGV